MFIPNSSLLKAHTNSQTSVTKRASNNTAIRAGVIIKVHEIDSETNVSKLLPEYDVLCEQLNGVEGSSFVEYKNCFAMDSLGGLADFFEKKLRVSDDKSYKKTYNEKEQNGSLVLLLCLDGFSDKPVIIGSKPHPGRKTNLTKDNELHMEGEYNGLNFQVNKEGELTVTFKSKTNNKGEPQNKEAGGAFVKMDKTGSIIADTGLKDDQQTYAKIDKPNKKIEMKAGDSVSVSAKKDVTVSAEGNFSSEVKADLSAMVEGAAKISAKSMISMESEGEFSAKASDIKLEAEALAQIKANKVLVDSPQIILGTGSTPAVTQLTQFQGIGNLGAPVISLAIGPFSGSVFIGS